MKRLLLTGFLLAATAFVPHGTAQSGGGGDYSHSCVAGELAAVVGVVTAGPINVCADGATVASGNTAVLNWVGQASAPGVAAGVAATHTWTLPVSGGVQGGCTATLTQAQVLSPVAQSSVASVVITMTGNQCRLILNYVLAYPAPVGTVYVVNFAIDVRVPSNYQLSYLCAHSTTTPNAFNPATGTCNEPSFLAELSGSIGVMVEGTLDVVNYFAEPLTVVLEGFGGGGGNSTVNFDLSAVVADWFPLGFALALLAIFSIRENYFVLGISGLFFLLAVVLCPFPTGELLGFTVPVVHVVVFFLAFYIIFVTGMQAKDWNDERKNQQPET